MPLIPYNYAKSQVLSVSRLLTKKVNTGMAGPFDSSVGSHTLHQNFSGFKQPGWRNVIKAGGNATTSASGSIEEFIIPETYGLMKRKYNFNGNIETFVATGNVGMFLNQHFLPMATSAPVNEVDNIALSKFLRACKGSQRQFSGGVFLGELTQTLKLIKNPASSLRALITDYVGACRRAPRRLSPRETLRHISNQWLEYSFGMLPLVSDIRSGYNALERLYLNPPSKYVTATEQRDFGTSVAVKRIALWSEYFPVLIHLKTSGTYSRTWRGEVRLAQRGIGSAPAQSAGATLRDFIPTVYELIPYSFLVDYFVNIGEILEAASFNTADLIWNCSTGRTETTKRAQIDPSRPSEISGGPLLDWSITPSEIVYKIKTFSRVTQPPGTIGMPSIAFKVPGNWSKFLNIGALASLRALR
jgi:hypothetical protein